MLKVVIMNDVILNESILRFLGMLKEQSLMNIPRTTLLYLHLNKLRSHLDEPLQSDRLLGIQSYRFLGRGWFCLLLLRPGLQDRFKRLKLYHRYLPELSIKEMKYTKTHKNIYSRVQNVPLVKEGPTTFFFNKSHVGLGRGK